MRRTVCTLGLALLVGIALGAFGTQVLSAQPETTTRTQPWPATVQAGEAVYLPPGQVHNTTNASTTAPAKALVAYVGEKGQPLVVPVQ